jgi:hypothetical protein
MNYNKSSAFHGSWVLKSTSILSLGIMIKTTAKRRVQSVWKNTNLMKLEKLLSFLANTPFTWTA